MSRYFLKLLLVLAALLAPCQTRAFSLLGIKATWMTGDLGYSGVDAGGPMFLGEAYRYNMPVLTYAYDASFLRYFGTNGVAAVDAAMAILNALPDADKMSEGLTEYQTFTRRSNAKADALGLVDLKSEVLSLMLEQMGVASPERYVWSLRAHFTDAIPKEYFSVFNPNYDPRTLEPTDRVNDVLYSYDIVQSPVGIYQAISFPVDPSAVFSSSVADYYQNGHILPYSNTRGYYAAYSAGVYFQALTREDVAAIRYMLRSQNYAVESLLADVRASTGGALGVSGGNGDGALTGTGFAGSGNGSPWAPAFSVFAANTATSGGSPWAPVISSTNLNPNVLTVTTANGLPRVVTALRPGVGSVKWVKISYDSLLSATTKPYLVTWIDRYVTNRTVRLQSVSRTITVPDMIFGAGDLGVINPNDTPVLIRRPVDAGAFITYSALNTTLGGVVETAGPGIVNSFKNISFSKLGRYYLNVTPPSPAIGQLIPDLVTLGYSWGSFTGGTNPIVAYPEGTSLRALEALVKRGL